MTEESVDVEESAGTSNDVTEKARMMGWIPPEEFKGDPSKHISAEEFVERGENLMPILKANNKKLIEELKQYKAEIDSQKTTMDKILKMQEKVAETAYNKAIDDIRIEQELAVESGNVKKWKELEAKKEKIEKPIIEKNTNVNPIKVDPEAQELLTANKYILMDQNIRNVAMQIELDIAKENPGIAGTKQHYQMVFEELHNIYPEKKIHGVGGQKSTPQTMLDGGSIRSVPAQSAKQGFNQLPKDAKEAALKYEAQGLMTKEQYAKEYFAI